jgi:hypothetical protein
VLRRRELGTAGAECRRVVGVACRRYEKHAGDRDGRGWSFPLHLGLTVSEGLRGREQKESAFCSNFVAVPGCRHPQALVGSRASDVPAPPGAP